MIQRRWFAAGLVLAACGGSGAGSPPVRPQTTAATAVQSFMRAVADSNLAKMASLWGTGAGPASKTHQPSDYERRIVIMQSYLRNDDSRIVEVRGIDVHQSDIASDIARRGDDELQQPARGRLGFRARIESRLLAHDRQHEHRVDAEGLRVVNDVVVEVAERS